MGQQSGSSTFVGGHGEAWPPVVGFTCQRWARLLSVSRPRASSCNGPLTTPSTPHHLSYTFPGRTRPKKEDWLKKKDRKQRRPGCRRKKKKRGGAPSQGPSLSTETLSSVLGTHSYPLTDTDQQGQMTLLRPSGGFPPGVARFPPNLVFFNFQTT